jgi:hypothetical protein
MCWNNLPAYVSATEKARHGEPVYPEPDEGNHDWRSFDGLRMTPVDFLRET